MPTLYVLAFAVVYGVLTEPLGGRPNNIMVLRYDSVW